MLRVARVGVRTSKAIVVVAVLSLALLPTLWLPYGLAFYTQSSAPAFGILLMSDPQSGQ
jgi:hypothetical protein